MHSKEGNLFVKIDLGEHSVLRPVPKSVANGTKVEMQTYLDGVVPGYLKELKDLVKIDKRNIRKKERHENKKAKQHKKNRARQDH